MVNINISQGGTYSVELLNILGQVVHSETVNINGNETLSRDFSSLSKGMYIMNIESDQYKHSSKLNINK